MRLQPAVLIQPPSFNARTDHLGRGGSVRWYLNAYKWAIPSGVDNFPHARAVSGNFNCELDYEGPDGEIGVILLAGKVAGESYKEKFTWSPECERYIR